MQPFLGEINLQKGLEKKAGTHRLSHRLMLPLQVQTTPTTFRGEATGGSGRCTQKVKHGPRSSSADPPGWAAAGTPPREPGHHQPQKLRPGSALLWPRRPAGWGLPEAAQRGLLSRPGRHRPELWVFLREAPGQCEQEEAPGGRRSWLPGPLGPARPAPESGCRSFPRPGRSQRPGGWPASGEDANLNRPSCRSEALCAQRGRVPAGVFLSQRPPAGGRSREEPGFPGQAQGPGGGLGAWEPALAWSGRCPRPGPRALWSWVSPGSSGAAEHRGAHRKETSFWPADGPQTKAGKSAGNEPETLRLAAAETP